MNIYSLISRVGNQESSMLKILSQTILISAEITNLWASIRRKSSSQSVRKNFQNDSNVDRYARTSLR